jgi:hypothetical protein
MGMTDENIVAALEKRDRQMRRDVQAWRLRQYRYLTRTTPEQLRADRIARDKAVLKRGWIIPGEPPQQDGSGI